MYCTFCTYYVHIYMRSEVTQSCTTLCNPTDCSLPGSSVRGIFQARILEWVAISFSTRPSQPWDWFQVSRMAGRRLTLWATREAPHPPSAANINTYLFRFFSLIVVLRYWIWFSVLYSRPLLLIYFVNSSVYILIPNPNLSHPPLPPLVTVGLFSMSVSLCFHFVNKLICIMFLDSTHRRCPVIFVFLLPCFWGQPLNLIFQF